MRKASKKKAIKKGVRLTNSNKKTKIQAASKVSKSVKKNNKTKSVKSSDKPAVVARGKDLLKNIKKPLTLSQQITYLSEVTGLPKKEVSLFMSSLEPMISFHLKNLQEISVGGLMKIVAVKKPATKARPGINPFTGQPTVFKAKPARKIVKIRPLKKVKAMV